MHYTFIMYSWKKSIISGSDTMRAAIKILELESSHIAMIVDKNGRLNGTITDGDIRRALIKKLPMDTQLSQFMCKNPTTSNVGDSRRSIFSKMKELGLLQIPIIDNDKKVIGIETLQHILDDKKYDNPVFLMAGGLGKRLQPLTEDTPKPLLKVGKNPILENILVQFIESGFHNFYMSIHYKADMVREYFGDGSNWNVSIKYVHEDKPLGTAGGLGLLPNNLPKLPILVMNGDLLTKIDFYELLNFHIQGKSDATMCVREYDFQVPYGVVKTQDLRIVSIEEKPVQRFFVNAGVYVLNSSIIEDMDGVNYIDMPKLLERVMEYGKVNMFPVHEYWLDIGIIEQFNQAQKDIGKFL